MIRAQRNDRIRVVMKVSGRELANKLLEKLYSEIRSKNLNPYLAVILAGPDPASRIYVTNKLKAAERVGVKAELFEFSINQKEECLKTIQQFNSDNNVDGIIVQQPMYEGWDAELFIQSVDSHKDVDGFKEDSLYSPGTALAVWEMLKEFAMLEGFNSTEEFLKDKKIVVLGRGKTAGAPIRELLIQRGYNPELIHSKTENPEEIINSSDIIISATGRKHIIHGRSIKEGAYVIGVGVGRDEEGKIFGDIDEESISEKAKYFCPNIGGIGPLNVAALLTNVVEASNK